MAIPNGTGGYQLGDGNTNEFILGFSGDPATATSSATLTVAQLVSQIVLGSPSTTAATYTLPTVALLEASAINAKVGSTFDFSIMNVNGSGSGVITVAAGTGWTVVGLATIAATAGTSGLFRARKTGEGTWSLYRIA